jgi:hypothetical protein
MRLLRRLSGNPYQPSSVQPDHPADQTVVPMTLLDIPAGSWGKIGEPSAVEAGMQALSSAQSRTIAQLQSYGLSSGAWVTMLQSTPVIILRVDHLELAMEKEIARQIIVTEISPRQGE